MLVMRVFEDVLAWGDAGFAEARHEQRICMSEFGISSVFDGFDKDDTGADFHEDHDVEVARLGTLGGFSGLVGEDSVTDIVDFGEDVVSFAAFEMGNQRECQAWRREPVRARLVL